MNVLAQTLLNLAFSIAPRQDRVWLEDMRYEAAFIENPLSWSFSALGLALRWRLAHILATPSQMAFASVAMAAVAAILILPNMTSKVTPANSVALPTPQSPTVTAESPDTYIDPSLSRSAEAQDVPAENGSAAYSEPLPPTLPAPSQAITEAELPEPIPIPPTLPSTPLAEAPTTPSDDRDVVLGDSQLETDEDVSEEEVSEEALSQEPIQEMTGMIPTDAATTSTEAASADTNATSAAPTSAETTIIESAPGSSSDTATIEAMIEAAVQQEKKDEVEALEVNTSTVRLKITKEVTLLVYQGTSINDELLFSGTTQTANLGYDLPIFIKASDGSAIELYLSADSSITLDSGEIERIIKPIP